MDPTSLLLAQIVGYTQVLSMAGVPSKFLPVCAVLIGALLAGLASLGSSVFIEQILAGAALGLAATGLINRVGEWVNKPEIVKEVESGVKTVVDGEEQLVDEKIDEMKPEK